MISHGFYLINSSDSQQSGRCCAAVSHGRLTGPQNCEALSTFRGAEPVNHLASGQTYLPYILLLPTLFSVGFCVVFFRGASQVEDLRIKFDYIQEQLGLPGRPHVEFLSDFLRLAGVLFGLVGIVLLVVFVLGVKA
jgi:hypothetical protein